MLKKFFTCCLGILVLSIVASCASPATPTATQAPTQATYKIALVMKTLTNPFFVEMEKGARQAETELGVELVVKTGAQETSVEQQIAIVEAIIENTEAQAIVIAPADSTALVPVLKKAQEAGLVIINIDNRLDPTAMTQLGLQNVPFISVDNQHGAYLSAQYISAKVTSPTAAIVIEGIRSAQNAEDRKNGALTAFAENANITVVAQETANWKIDEAYTVAKELFTQHPEVKLVFCANDMMALGVIQYLEENQRTDVQVAAYDALAEAIVALKAGTLQATIDQQAALQGYTGVQFALRALQGETLPAETLVEIKLVTAADVK